MRIVIGVWRRQMVGQMAKWPMAQCDCQLQFQFLFCSSCPAGELLALARNVVVMWLWEWARAWGWPREEFIGHTLIKERYSFVEIPYQMHHKNAILCWPCFWISCLAVVYIFLCFFFAATA